jgi:hypothetical protein
MRTFASSLKAGAVVAARHAYTVLSCLILLVACHEAVRAQGWNRFTYAIDGFEVEFSGNVLVSALPLDAKARIVRSTSYQQDGGDFSYMVNAVLVQDSVNFENGIRVGYGEMKCATAIRDTSFVLKAIRAREIHGADCVDGNYRAETRYFTTGKWFYQVIALYKRTAASTRARNASSNPSS